MAVKYAPSNSEDAIPCALLNSKFDGQTVSLFEFLSKHICDTSVASDLIRQADDAEYKRLLRSILVVPSDAAKGTLEVHKKSFMSALVTESRVSLLPAFPSSPYTHTASLNEVIHAVIERLFKGTPQPSNLLTLGFRKTRHAGMSGMHYVEAYFPNTLVNHLRSAFWELLLTRIGDAAMTYVLLYLCIFVPVNNGCFFQLTGTPLFDQIQANEKLDDGSFLQRKSVSTKKVSKVSPKPSVISNQENNLSNEKSKDSQTVIFSRNKCFYSFNQRRPCSWYAAGLPKNHLLNVMSRHFQLGDDHASCLPLIASIFPRRFGQSLRQENVIDASGSQCFQKKKFQEQRKMRYRLPKRLKSVLPILIKMIKNHGKLRYSYSLNHYCPIRKGDNREHLVRLPTYDSDDVISQGEDIFDIVSLIQEERKQEDSVSFCNRRNYHENSLKSLIYMPCAELVDLHLTPRQVTRFIQSILYKVVPLDMWGSEQNRNIVFKAAEKFISMSRYGKLAIHDAFRGFKINCCSWNRGKDITKRHLPTADSLLRHDLSMEFLHWLFESLVIPLIRTNFYVTENAQRRNKVFYYRKEVWNELSKRALKNRQERLFKEISVHDARDMLYRREIGYASLRFLPKEGGMRPIVNMKKKLWKWTEQGQRVLSQSINGFLQNIFHVLNYEKTKRPNIIGASILSQNDIYMKFKKFRQAMVQKGYLGKKLYFAKIDVKSAFDTIKHEKLWEILQNNIFTEDEYIVHRHAVIHPSTGHIKKSFRRRALSGGDFPQFQQFAQELSNQLKNAILVDQVVYTHEECDALLKLLKEHLFYHILKFGKKFYHQMIGIPQGSMLSTLLCSLFYADMEKKFFSYHEHPDILVMRFVDDTLFISPSKEAMMTFLVEAHRDNEEYGWSVNRKKTLVNFECTIGSENLKTTHDIRQQLTHDNDFPWCGYLINAKTLEIRTDYSRYWGIHVEETLTTESPFNLGTFFEAKLVHYLKRRLHHLLLDQLLNSRETVLLNVYENFLMCAMKFHGHVVKMINQCQTDQHSHFLYEKIIYALKYTFTMIQSIRKSPFALSQDFACSIAQRHLEYIGCIAFIRVLARKQSRYTLLLQLLEQRKTQLSEVMSKPELESTSTLQWSCQFDNILY